MEENKKNNCGCESKNGSSCCEPTSNKNNKFGKVAFFAIIAIATIMIVFKVFIKEPATASENGKEVPSCCAKDAKEKTPSCCTKDTTNKDNSNSANNTVSE